MDNFRVNQDRVNNDRECKCWYCENYSYNTSYENGYNFCDACWVLFRNEQIPYAFFDNDDIERMVNDEEGIIYYR